MFPSILTVFRELLNINKTYIKICIINYFKNLAKSFVDIIKLFAVVQNWSVRSGCCSFIAF